MADGVAITAGSGTTILTDDTGATGHAQVVKLAISTDASPTLIPADAANGIDVDVTRVQGVVDVEGPAANGATATGNPVIIGGIDGTTVRTLAMAADGHPQVDIMGNVAHDAIDADNPVKMGARARSAVITSVASDDRTDAIATLQGYPVYFPFALPQSGLTGTSSTTAATDTAVIAAQGAGITICVTSIAVYNDSTTNTFVNIKDGATTRLVIPAPAKGGAMHTLPFPLRLTANTALNFASGSAVTTMYVSAVGFASI